MPRMARGLADGHVYHIINRGNCRQQVFHKNEDYQAFHELMKEAVERYPVAVYAYCLMPNHFHLLVSPERAKDLSTWMQWLMTSHVRRYHSYYKTSGHVWQGRFKSFIVQQDSHLLNVVRYIESNPVRAGIVPSATEWLWSSHNCRNQSGTGFLTKLPVRLLEKWTEYVDQPQTESELERLRKSINRQTPYGSPGWQEKIVEALGLTSTMNPKGRPKK
jgi:putative transposase